MSGDRARLEFLGKQKQVLEDLVDLYRKLATLGPAATIATLEAAERGLATSHAILRDIECAIGARAASPDPVVASAERLLEELGEGLREELAQLSRTLEASIRAERDEIARVLRGLRAARRVVVRYRSPSSEGGSLLDASA